MSTDPWGRAGSLVHAHDTENRAHQTGEAGRAHDRESTRVTACSSCGFPILLQTIILLKRSNK